MNSPNLLFTASIEDLRRALRAVQCGERVLGETQAVTQVVVEFQRLASERHRLQWGLSTRSEHIG